jgi:hypothetical protein
MPIVTLKLKAGSRRTSSNKAKIEELTVLYGFGIHTEYFPLSGIAKTGIRFYLQN